MECVLHHVFYGARLETSVYGLALEIYARRDYKILEAKTCFAFPNFPLVLVVIIFCLYFVEVEIIIFCFSLLAFCN
ncbi:unnamed protein product [Lathyrus sativus]|nr:unnamed protein product [Lathyrus sativus]